jgi:hypothetical protein
MAIEKTTTEHAPQNESAPAAVMRECLEGIAMLCIRLDRECYHGIQEAPQDAPDWAEQNGLLLQRLRDAIAHIGYLADVGTEGEIRGGAGDWLPWPSLAKKMATRQASVAKAAATREGIRHD